MKKYNIYGFGRSTTFYIRSSDDMFRKGELIWKFEGYQSWYPPKEFDDGPELDSLVKKLQEEAPITVVKIRVGSPPDAYLPSTHYVPQERKVTRGRKHQ